MSTMPPEARRRGKVDTLFSAEWFDGDAPPAEPELDQTMETLREAPDAGGVSRQTVILVVAAVALAMLLAVALLGVSVAAGVAYFLLA